MTDRWASKATTQDVWAKKKKIRARQNKRERGIIDIAAQRKNESIKNLSTGDG